MVVWRNKLGGELGNFDALTKWKKFFNLFTKATKSCKTKEKLQKKGVKEKEIEKYKGLKVQKDEENGKRMMEKS